jgi:nucleotide-binding universal stress UspA family protein
MYKRVLVPVDGSETAEAILPFILEIAGPLDIDIVLLRVITPVPPVVVEASPDLDVVNAEAAQEEAEAYLSGLAAEIRAKGLRVARLARRGEPVAEILGAARDVEADLIAMTTHGRTGPARLLFGSIAEGVLRHADTPVFLMRHTERELALRPREEARR